MSIFTDIAAANAVGGGNYIDPGQYLLEVRNVKNKAAGFKGSSYIVEFLVRESTVLVEGKKPNPVGAQVSCVWNLTNDSKPGKRAIMLGHVKAFVLALFNTTEAETPEDVVASGAEEITNEDPKATTKDTEGKEFLIGIQPARGRLVRAVTRDVTTKEGKTFCVPVFSGVKQTDEEIAARRAAQAA